MPLTYYLRIVREIMLKGSTLADLRFDTLALAGLMLFAMIIAISRFRRTLDYSILMRPRKKTGAHSVSVETECALAPRVLAVDVLAGMVAHQRGRDQADQRADRDIARDRIGRVKEPEQPGRDQRRRAA